MKTLLRLSLICLAGLAMISPASAGSPVKRTLVRDARGQVRVAYVRVADNRILFPRVVQKITDSRGCTQYRRAVCSSYRPSHLAGRGCYDAFGRRCYPGYATLGNYGADAILRSRRSGYANAPLANYGVNAVYGRSYSGYSQGHPSSGNYGVNAILNNGNRGHSGHVKGE
jgi:hypothetical protein